MITADLYYPLYFLLVSIMTIIVCNNYATYSVDRVISNFRTNNSSLLVLTVFLIIVIGFRPAARIFTDMSNYIIVFNARSGEIFQPSWDVENKIFDNYMNLLISLGFKPVALFFTTAIVYFSCMSIALKKIFPKDALLAFIVYLAAFSTLSYGTNGIKAGAAASMFMLAIAYRENLKLLILFSALSWGLHHSMFFVIAGAATVTFYKKTKHYFLFWCFALLCAAAHITFFQELFASASDAKGASYLSSEGTDYFRTTTFRLDFVLYSAFPVFIGYKMYFKYKIRSEMYEWILNLYLVLNGIWMLCMYAEFTNRIAYLSWFILPILIIYPYLNEYVNSQQYKILNKVVYVQLAFSLFMNFIYYAFIKPIST